MQADSFPFGALSTGEEATAYRLCRGDISAVVIDYGAALQSLIIPGRDGCSADVVLGYGSAAEYERYPGNMGATVGRYANRIGFGEFTLDGHRYLLARNSPPNHLHGGVKGFDRRMWRVVHRSAESLTFSRLSPDGEEGYPGDLRVEVSYTLTDRGLRMDYHAVTDAPTPISLTNHSYLNLSGGGSAMAHELKISADDFTENDENCLPTGRILPVDGTPFDFRTAKPIGRDIDMRDAQLAVGHGYDHNFALRSRDAAVLYSHESGIELSVTTDMPGLQLYTANFMDPVAGKYGESFTPRCAVCLETQEYPDAPNHENFPSAILRPGEEYHRMTEWTFRIR